MTTTQIKPFEINIPQSALDDSNTTGATVGRTNCPAWVMGSLSYVKHCRHLTGYDCAGGKRLNQYPQFTTIIDRQNIHFLHVRSPEPDALPLIVTHGWPGSIVEFLDIIEPLTNPQAHGGDPADAFHLIIPSLPGYGFSGPTHEVGWNQYRSEGVGHADGPLVIHAMSSWQRAWLNVSPELGRVDAITSSLHMS
jgi:pimeloyl-ACP methyl ester carboxylesterase